MTPNPSEAAPAAATDRSRPTPAPAPPLQHLAIVGAGPVGLVLALQAQRKLPGVRITVYDALPREHDVSRDARTLALAQGTVLDLERLGLWSQVAPHAAPIQAVHVSQQQPGLLDLLPLPGRRAGSPELLIRAAEEGLPQLGAVVPYGALVAPLRAAWLAACEQEPQRLAAAWGVPVAAIVSRPDDGPRTAANGGGRPDAASGAAAEAAVDAGWSGVEVDAGVVERHELAVIAEGGVFADQSRKAVHRDYHQTAWVGTVTLDGGEPGVAYERFTPQGPAALLPLPPRPGGAAAGEGAQRAALVWCVQTGDDPVRELDDAQRLAVLQHVMPTRVGRLRSIGPLKAFPLGLNAERSLVQGRTVRIGNAAQTLHPVAGQGLNLGLRDAHALLAALTRHPDVDRALQAVAWQRAPDRWALIAATDFLARSFTWPLPGLTSLRGAGLSLLNAVPPLRSQLARRMMFGAR